MHCSLFYHQQESARKYTDGLSEMVSLLLMIEFLCILFLSDEKTHTHTHTHTHTLTHIMQVYGHFNFIVGEEPLSCSFRNTYILFVINSQGYNEVQLYVLALLERSRAAELIRPLAILWIRGHPAFINSISGMDLETGIYPSRLLNNLWQYFRWRFRCVILQAANVAVNLSDRWGMC